MRILIPLAVPLLISGCRTGESLPPVPLGAPLPIAVSEAPAELLARQPGTRHGEGDRPTSIVIHDGQVVNLGPLPQYVIDGELLPTGTPELDARARARLATIAAGDMLAVSLLKGIEAVARFGPAAAGGVILVTTRAGQAAARQERRQPPGSRAP